MSTDQIKHDVFVWPPNDAPITPPPLPHNPKNTPSPLHAMIDSIETDLLGRIGLSFDRWAQRTNWRPDSPDRYCWRCAGSVGSHEQDGEGCATCRKTKLPWDRAMRLSAYNDEIRREVLALKFAAWRPGGLALGKYLGELIQTQVERANVQPEQVRIVPIPMHPLRRIRRGIDHTLVLARSASNESGFELSKALRARYRPEQVGLSATARARNVKHAFETRPRILRADRARNPDFNRVWVFIDDVRTTGATFTAACKTLKRGLRAESKDSKNDQLWICSVGVTQSQDRREVDVKP